MFRKAVTIAQQFTQPVILCRRTVNGNCSSNIGCFVVINDEGWIVTAGHIIEQMKKLNEETVANTAHEKRVADIRNDPNITPKERSKQLSNLGRPSGDATNAYSVIWGKHAGAQLRERRFAQKAKPLLVGPSV
jgi:hypothetical protein